MTATLKRINKLVFVDELDLIRDNIKLLKSKHEYNKGISSIKENEIEDLVLLEQACKTFKELKKQYEDNNELKNTRPAMLIQIENVPSNLNEK